MRGYNFVTAIFLKITEPVEARFKQEEGGTHADEIETSMMLFIAPSTVDMSKAVKDYHPSPKGGLMRDPNGEGSYSASGVYGDVTLATRQKGHSLPRFIYSWSFGFGVAELILGIFTGVIDSVPSKDRRLNSLDDSYRDANESQCECTGRLGRIWRHYLIRMSC